jgi:hypothetical protein
MNVWTMIVIIWIALVVAVPSLGILAAPWFGQSQNGRHRQMR